MVITGSKFEGNTAGENGNNIKEFAGDVTCDDDGNTFESSGVPDSGNFPIGLCE